eukprot:scaffold32534_cov49-Phaeocystis_antarctica.AAC.4
MPHRCVTDAVGYRTVGSTRLEGVEMNAKVRGTRVGRAGSPGRTTTAWRVSARCTCATAPSPRAKRGVLRHAPGEDLIRTRVIALLRHRRAPAHLRHLVRHQVLVHLEGVGARVRVRVTRCTKVYQVRVHLLSTPVALAPAAREADRRAAAVDDLLELEHAPGPERTPRVVHLVAYPVDVEEHDRVYHGQCRCGAALRLG